MEYIALAGALVYVDTNLIIPLLHYRRLVFNFEFRVLSTFAINRFANKNVYYNTVRDRQSQLLDLQFGPT